MHGLLQYFISFVGPVAALIVFVAEGRGAFNARTAGLDAGERVEGSGQLRHRSKRNPIPREAPGVLSRGLYRGIRFSTVRSVVIARIKLRGTRVKYCCDNRVYRALAERLS